MQYEDFDVSIEALAGRTYRVAVLQSPAGEAQESVEFPFDAVALDLHLTKLENALLKSSSGRRLVLSPEEQDALVFGKALFDFLMQGEVGRRYAVSYDRCQQAGKGLRLKLRIQEPVLAALPWEFIHDKRFNHYLALSQRTPVLRYLELPRPLTPLHVTPPLRMLGMVANPRNLPTLDVAAEKERIRQATTELEAEGLLELTWLEGQGWRNLLRAMRRGPWHIFHFIGHGGFDRERDEGYLMFADRQGEAQRMNATSLARLLGDHDTLRVALLNACEGGQSGTDVFSSTAATLVRSGVPCVLAMQYVFTDEAAIEFARTFYEALADGLPMETTVSDARKSIALHREGSLEWGTPVFFTHAPDGVLFDVAADTNPSNIKPQTIENEKRGDPTASEILNAAEDTQSESDPLIQTYDLIRTHFNETEVKELCFYLSINYEALDGSNSAEKVRELILYCQRRERLGALHAELVKQRPQVAWPEFPVSTHTTSRSHRKQPWRLNARGLPLIESWEQLQDVAELPPRIVWLQDGKEMALIRAGSFTMGSAGAEIEPFGDWEKQEERLLAEMPQRHLTLPTYYMDVTPVTHGEYARFLATNPDHPVPTETDRLLQPYVWDKILRQPPEALRHHPVVLVDWHSAISYARWAGKLLPTEEQWEKGARGSDARLYPWGNDWDWQRVNSAERHYGGDFDRISEWQALWGTIDDAEEALAVFTSPVGAYVAGASPYGLLDMSGNVWEWCGAWFDAYPGSTNLHEDFGRKHRVVRGGSWLNFWSYLRCASRYGIVPNEKFDYVGFRCASITF